MPKHCLSLICNPDVAEKLLDVLLTAVSDQVFTSTPTFSHGTPHGRLSGAEQVMGRSSSVQIQLIVTEEQLKSTLDLVLANFKGTGLYFWAYELSAEGVVE
ncbi:MAG: DUF3240 domain-containing protein [Alicycliphilus sp.]|jgi:hypothetical protein|nr:MAG: DUF3240 domain-containing protein [Alicycliphilus sp.]